MNEGILFLAGVALIAGVITLLDWLGERREKRSH